MPAAVSQPGLALLPGIRFRSTKTKKSYQLAHALNAALLIEGEVFAPAETTQEIVRRWDADKSCQLEVSTRTVQAPPPPAPSGFTDADLEQLLRAQPWGVIYVTSAYPPAVRALADLRPVVTKAGGHLTVLLHPDLGRWPLPPHQLQPVLDAAGVTALQPVASRELRAFDGVGLNHGNYPITFIYRGGLLSIRTRVGPLSAQQFERWITMELARLKADLD
jgi:hypothetical protein